MKKHGVDKDENEGSGEKDKERHQRHKCLCPTDFDEIVRLASQKPDFSK